MIKRYQLMLKVAYMFPNQAFGYPHHTAYHHQTVQTYAVQHTVHMYAAQQHMQMQWL